MITPTQSAQRNSYVDIGRKFSAVKLPKSNDMAVISPLAKGMSRAFQLASSQDDYSDDKVARAKNIIANWTKPSDDVVDSVMRGVTDV